MTSGEGPADVVVVGAGLVGLACALALAERDLGVVLVDEPRTGAASAAGAGLLAPSLGSERGAARVFGTVARDRFPPYVDALRERTGLPVSLDREGILELAPTGDDADRLRDSLPAGAEWLDRDALRRVEPSLAHAAGAVLHPDDGAVDNVALLEAMARLAAATPRIRRLRGAARHVEIGERRAAVRLAGVEGAVSGRALVLAAGAWSAAVTGLPRAIPVEPVRGQMLALDGAPVRHVVYGPEGYLLPRAGLRTLVGSTTERVGFDASTTASGIASLAQVATRMCPALVGAPPVAAWAGLRPMTPDGLPLLGRDPLAPALVYATGHSRNGILGAPLTGECVAALVCGESPPVDLSPFSPARFGR